MDFAHVVQRIGGSGSGISFFFGGIYVLHIVAAILSQEWLFLKRWGPWESPLCAV